MAEPTQQPQPRRKRFIPNYEVNGVHKIALSEDTQVFTEMIIGPNVTCMDPWKFVDKERILEHMDQFGDSSEFLPLREEILAYKGDSLLMGYIADETKDYDEFYICVTRKARDHCKQQSERFIKRQKKKLEKAVVKTPKPWVCLGSDVEMYELLPINNRSLIEVEIDSKYPTTYDPPKFTVQDCKNKRDGYIELTPYRQKYNVIFRRRIDGEVQVAPPRVENHAQTDLKYPQNKWTQTLTASLGPTEDTSAGGDTKKDKLAAEVRGEVLEEESDEEIGKVTEIQQDENQVLSYQAAIMRLRRPSYIKSFSKFISSVNEEMTSCIILNSIMDMYSNDYPKLVTEKAADIYSTMAFDEYICFTDVRAKNKFISSASFHPMWSGIVAIAYADGCPGVMKFLGNRPDPVKRAVYGLNPVMIWSHTDSLIPKLTLETPREVKSLSFCPFNENILVGGCYNGQVIIWDITNKLEQVETIEVLSEQREKFKIAMESHMTWMKNVHDKTKVLITVVSNLMTSHYGPVTAINWISPNFIVTSTGKVQLLKDGEKSLMFMTGSEDGCILFWNLSVENVVLSVGKKVKKSKRVPIKPAGLTLDVSPLKVLDRILQPVFKINLGVAGSPKVLPLQSLCFNRPDIKYHGVLKRPGTGRKYYSCEIPPQTEKDMSNTIYCGSMHGQVMKLSWEGHDFNTGELVNSELADIHYSCYIHDGVITYTATNPFLSDIVLTVGGKIFALWSVKVPERPILWKKEKYRLTDGRWSLYKPSIIFISTAEGVIETWDLIVRSDQPVASQTLSGSSLTSLNLHTLQIEKNILGVSDMNGSFKMYLYPKIFMIENPQYIDRFRSLIDREFRVMNEFTTWQKKWMEQNAHIFIERRRQELLVLAEKEAKRKLDKEKEEKRQEELAEARMLEKMRVIGPEEKWQRIINGLIERCIAVKKRINKAELLEHERPLRQLEEQTREKAKRMFQIMKQQKNIFNDTVAILFPEAIKKPEKPKKTLLPGNKESMKKEYLNDFEDIRNQARQTVKTNPYRYEFSWEATLAEGKERRECLTSHINSIKSHKLRIDAELKEPVISQKKSLHPETNLEEEEEGKQ